MSWWQRIGRFDQRGAAIADRHYSRQKHGTPQFVTPGRCLVLRHLDDALWVTSWPEFVRHDWPGAWNNTLFRNESERLSSELIREAVAHTRARWPQIPVDGMITMIDPGRIRRKRDPGRCYLRAGFCHAGWTAGGLRVLQLHPADMPAPVHCWPEQLTLEVAP